MDIISFIFIDKGFCNNFCITFYKSYPTTMDFGLLIYTMAYDRYFSD